MADTRLTRAESLDGLALVFFERPPNVDSHCECETPLLLWWTVRTVRIGFITTAYALTS